jgi:methylmalonyl-CoA/ethylmalonyl-CoA epimerase
MVAILELLTVNIAVDDLDEAVSRYENLGISHVPPEVMVEPPASITDVSFPLPGGSALSLIHPTDAASPVRRFLDRKGPGVYSVAVRVDDLRGAMREWGAKGFEWVLEEPHVIPDGGAVEYRVERLLMNWVKPRSLGGVMLEVFEFQGEVRRND